MQIDILVFPGADELDLMAPYEVLKNAAACGAKFETQFVAISAPGEFLASHGARLWAQGKLDANSPPDVLVVPGGGWIDRVPQGARAEAERGDIPRLIKQLHDGGTVIAAVCTGSMLLAAAGLLNNKPATTHHEALDDLKAAGARLVDARLVDAGNIITAGGVTSGLDLALWLVERFAGGSIACKVESQLEYQRRGTVWRAEDDRH